METGNYRYSSPLRYPGGKTILANYIKLVLLHNDLIGKDYVEVYAGGAGIAFSLLFDNFVDHIHLNDYNKSIYAFWHAVLSETEEICRLITDTPINIEQWEKQKTVQNLSENHSLLELGFSTFFLNRTNYSGILKGGVIGGKQQTGKWKIDARYNKPELVKRIQRIAKYGDKVSVDNRDGNLFIKEKINQLPKKALVYLDPPYYLKGKKLYDDHYEHEDHVLISKSIRGQINQHWIVSYDAVPQIMELYRGYPSTRYSLSYSVKERYAGNEIMFFSKALNLPEVSNPARVKKSDLNNSMLQQQL